MNVQEMWGLKSSVTGHYYGRAGVHSLDPTSEQTLMFWLKDSAKKFAAAQNGVVDEWEVVKIEIPLASLKE